MQSEIYYGDRSDFRVEMRKEFFILNKTFIRTVIETRHGISDTKIRSLVHA